MPPVAKEFVLTSIFKNVSEMKDGIKVCSEEAEHFGVPWKMYIKRDGENIGVYLCCSLDQAENWQIEVEGVLSIITVTGKVLSKVMKSALGKSEDRLTVLVVENVKFHVSKLFLARQSSYFKSLLLGNFAEAKQSEVTLSSANSIDFQNYLEVLHGEPAIDDDTVNGILNLADMYDTPTVVRQCEKFLIEKSVKLLKQKLELSKKYNFKNLKNKCLSEIKSIDDIRSVLSADVSQMDPSVLASLLQKSISYQSK
ncbi:hypothetical protein L5515_015298 [Caenorhabditis briggsae]|uniref:BTB domain-containing protein n=1 Tax=Caenorhabditis briggsae TaxID=6238 RepID=A0AAE9EDS5_CAEBR|nr:hypothetical protein L5515_015298 [Caenorhabditis briggsae]